MKRKFGSAEIRTRLFLVKIKRLISLAMGAVTYVAVKLVNLSLLVS